MWEEDQSVRDAVLNKWGHLRTQPAKFFDHVSEITFHHRLQNVGIDFPIKFFFLLIFIFMLVKTFGSAVDI